MADQGWEQVAAEAERLCEAATKGPWTFDVELSADEYRTPSIFVVTEVGGQRDYVATTEHCVDESDARFIARARSLVPELAALVRQQAAEVASLTAILRAGARSVGAADISESDSGATCLGAILRRYDEAQAALALSAAEVTRLRERYNNLIFAVGKKYPNETRHETARRYIVQAESFGFGSGADAAASLDAARQEPI